MSLDWYPAIREFCSYWRDAPMLQQTFHTLEHSFSTDNDACIDAAKCVVEVACQIIVDELDNPLASLKPKEENPKFGVWVSAAVRALKLGDIRNSAFQKLISQHHKLTTTLGNLRNDAGPVSHGRDGFIERLSSYHRRAAVLSADAVVAFLHQTYLEAELNLARTREPYDRFRNQNDIIDEWCGYGDVNIEDGGSLSVSVNFPNEESALLINVSLSQFLFQVDRPAYIEALNAARTAESFEEDSI
ncbi:abortive infection family protein [Azospirillum sp. B506]|uniref:abortive infection family protein n=1 Tax=Azospirillum sp. B506 TaxID=137721 RepID=UPI0009FFAB5A|nr:abortive infection family protein [Azospirillum sp. B506]